MFGVPLTNERQVSGLILRGGQAGDAPVGEEMLAEVLAHEEVKGVGADRAYDSDARRVLIAAANKEALIPPRSHRVNPPDYDREKYEHHNKVERPCNRLKHFRAMAPAPTNSPTCSWAASSPPRSLSRSCN